MELEDIMVLNNVTKFQKILINNIWLREWTSFQMVNFQKQRAITTESMVRYGQLSNLKTSWYLTIWPGFIKFWSKVFDLESGRRLDRHTYVPLDRRKYVQSDGGNTKCPGHCHGGGIMKRVNLQHSSYKHVFSKSILVEYNVDSDQTTSTEASCSGSTVLPKRIQSVIAWQG